MKLMAILAAVLLIVSPAAADVNEAIDAAVHIKTPDAIGSGVVVAVDDASVSILTCWHVVQKGPVEVCFFRDGWSSGHVPATVAWSSYAGGPPRDLALVRVARSALGDHLPAVVPLAPEGYRPETGQTVFSTGCPKGSYPNSFKGHLNAAEEALLQITPCTLEGRSGSGLLDAEGKFVIGIIAWRDENYGYAVSAQEIDRAIRGEPPAAVGMIAASHRVLELGTLKPVLPSFGCGPRGCPPGQQQPSGPPASPGGGFTPWPGKPPRYGPPAEPPPTPGPEDTPPVVAIKEDLSWWWAAFPSACVLVVMAAAVLTFLVSQMSHLVRSARS